MAKEKTPEINLRVRPLDDRIVVEPLEAEEKTAGGILLPDTAKQKPQRGRVLAVGPGKLRDSGERSTVAVVKGDEVLYGRYGGSDIQVEGEVANREEHGELKQCQQKLCQQLSTQERIFLYRRNEQAAEGAILFLLQNSRGGGIDAKEGEEDGVSWYRLVKVIGLGSLTCCKHLYLCALSRACAGISYGTGDSGRVNRALSTMVSRLVTDAVNLADRGTTCILRCDQLTHYVVDKVLYERNTCITAIRQ